MVSWLAFGVLSVSPGASNATAWSPRPVARESTRSCLMFAPTWVVVRGDGASPVTVTVSCTLATARAMSRGTVAPRARVMLFSIVEKPVSFELSGFSTIEKSITLALGATVPLDIALAVANVQETVTVTGEAPSPLTTTQVGANIKQDLVDSLATGRGLQAVALLAPGLTDKTPNANQLTIAGSFAYDNVFLLDGVDINDNLFGSPNNLFIEDALEETQILTSGVSAEYGRFSGGVVNAVTKRGSNTFAGSFRANLTNPSWRDETPIEKQQK